MWDYFSLGFDPTPTQVKLIGSLILVLGLTLLRVLLHRLINNKVRELRNRYAWRQSVTYFVVLNIAVGLLTIWLEWFRNILPMLSLVAAALTIVSKELILNFVAYWVIIWRGVFSIGDRIQITQNVGDVMEIGFLYITLAEVGNWVNGDEPSGRVIKIPNSLVLTQPVSNYSRGVSLIWNELTLELPLASDWRKVRETALEVLTDITHPFSEQDLSQLRDAGEELMFARREPAVYIRPHGEKITLALRYACKFERRRRTEQAIWDELLLRLAQQPEPSPGQNAPSPQ